MLLGHLWRQPIMSNQAGLQHVFKSSLHKLRSEGNLKKVISEKIHASQLVSKNFRKNYGVSKVCDITVDMMYEGMQNIPCLVCETTSCDEDQGVCLQGYSIPECHKLLSKPKISSQPMPESLFWLLMTGDIPTDLQTESISKEWVDREYMQPHVVTMINHFPVNLHPMTQLSAAITTLSCTSRLRQAYTSGVHKINYWEYVYEDSMNLIATLPAVIALVYQKYAQKTQFAGGIGLENNEDWSANCAKNVGYNSSDFIDLLRLYICFGHDSDNGNASIHTAHIVGSALSDPYLAFASSLNVLAGPLLSNEKSILFLKNMQSYVGSKPSDKKVTEFLMNAMAKCKRTLPGFHNIPDKAPSTDLRIAYFQEFGNKHLPEDPLFELATQLARLGHDHLITVDVLAGIFFEFYKVYTTFHPVMKSLSLLIHIASSLVWDRALGYPIEHPISMSTSCLMKACKHHDMGGHTL